MHNLLIFNRTISPPLNALVTESSPGHTVWWAHPQAGECSRTGVSWTRRLLQVAACHQVCLAVISKANPQQPEGQMFCVHCGAYLESSAASCSVCGKPNPVGNATSSSSAASVAVASAPAPSAAPPALAQERPSPEVERLRAEHPELVGVRGWLAWFCIIAAIISPIIVVVGILSEPSPYSVFHLALAVFSVVTGIAIWKLWPQALKLTKILLIIQFVIGAILVASQILNSSAMASSNASPDAGGARALVGSIVWFSYFKKSRRVRATFGRNI